MPSISMGGKVAFVTPGVFVDAGGWEIDLVNGKIVVKRIPPPWDGDPILWASILISSSLQRLATITDKANLESELMMTADAILTAYSKDIDQMMLKLNPHLDPDKVPELRFIWLKMFGCDGGGIGLLPGGKIVKIPGWTPEMLIPLVGGLEHLSEVTKKPGLKSRLKTLAKNILEVYTPELKKVAESMHVEELAHV